MITVYDIVAPDGTVEYVGQTNNPVRRLAQHRAGSEWMTEGHEMRLAATAGSRSEALRIEARRIHDMAPRRNIVRPVPSGVFLGPAPDNWIGTVEAAQLLGWSVAKVKREAAAGNLPGHKMPGQTGAWLFDRTDITARSAAS